MTKLKLKIEKAKHFDPNTRTMGYAARVISNGKATYDDIVADACHNTTLHKAEAKTAFELCMESVARKLKQGYIVDLGPVGRLYPACTGGWYKQRDEMQLAKVKPSLYYRPAADVKKAIKEATLQWVKDGSQQEENDNPPSTD